MGRDQGPVFITRNGRRKRSGTTIANTGINRIIKKAIHLGSIGSFSFGKKKYLSHFVQNGLGKKSVQPHGEETDGSGFSKQ
jgi:hypothetical protein